MKCRSGLFLVGLFFLVISVVSVADVKDEPIVVGQHRVVQSKILDEGRDLYIHLPEGYDTSGESYPVLFQLYAHFQYAYFLPQLCTMESLGAHGRTPAFIVVGIRNQQFRYRDLLPTDHFGGKSEIDRFLAFFQQELVPFINREYRALDFRVLSGPQAGAAFGVYAMSKQPDLFNGMILTNPFWIQSSRQVLLDLFQESLGSTDLSSRFMMVSHEDSEAPEAIRALDRFERMISEAGNHAPRFVRNRLSPDFSMAESVDLEQGMMQLFIDYPFPAGKQGQQLAVIQQHYSDISKRLGLPLQAPELTLVFEGDKYMEAGDLKSALAIFSFMLEGYPDSLMALDRLGGVHAKLGNRETAIGYYKRFLEQQPGNPRITGIMERLSAEN